MYERKVLPFYMTYPLPMYYQEEDAIMRDLEYLQQMYPMQAKKYQKMISGILDKLDYEGSVIYDEYPDRYTLERTADNITDIIRRAERQKYSDQENPGDDGEPRQPLIFVLLVNEVYKRRRGGKRGFFSLS